VIRVAVCGACGRMGKLIVQQVAKQRDMKLAAAIDAPNTPFAGRDAGEVAGVGELRVKVVGAERLRETLQLEKPDVLVDFTRADAAVANVETAASSGVPVVVGTTGFSQAQLGRMAKAVKKGRVAAVVAPNMSVGVNVFFKLVGETARVLGRGYDVEIVEAHHVRKLDAPSGTALRAAEIIARELGLSKRSIKCGRPAGEHPRRKEEIYIHSIRAGDIVGEHTVVFSAPGERVEIVHRAHSRETFAAGTMNAIRHVVKRGKPGVIQDMQDALGL